MPGRKRTLISFLIVAAPLIVSAVLGGCGGGSTEARSYHCPMHPTYVADREGDCPICGMRLVAVETSPKAADSSGYVCPMHPDVTSDRAGTCPECGMQLEAARVGGEARAPVVLPPDVVQMAGIETEAASLGRISRSVRSSATVLADPHRVQHVVSRADGWIERLEVKASGAWVRRGQPLYTLYAPDMVPVQEEFLRYVRTREAGASLTEREQKRRPPDREAAALQRLERYGLPGAFIADLEQDLVAKPSIPFPAPVSGFVQLAGVFEGQRVEPGMELMTISDLSEVWVEADVFESDAPHVRIGEDAAVIPLIDPAERLPGRVINVNPFLDASNRTIKVRLRCPNERLVLKPGMFASVELTVRSEEGILVPSSAVLDTGVRRVAYVETGDGRFEPRVVQTGLTGGGKTQILAGISAGEKVAWRANFLLDSESRLRGAAAEAGQAGRAR